MKKVATDVVRILFNAGFIAYFAGGWVRDFLLGQNPSEIDIATSAPPEKIMQLFPKTIPVGVAFGVVIVVHQGIPFEVTTFRKDHPYHDGRHPEGVDFSTPEKDASRRDFTINGMFFDPLTDELFDYVEGKLDLQKKIIRAIGDPQERFQEDKLRMIRAIRFAARLNFTIEKNTLAAIQHLAPTLFPAVSIERVWQELTKMSQSPHFSLALQTLHQVGLLHTIFPITPDFTHISTLPFPIPTIVTLLQLFPHTTLEERIQLCRYLKTSQADIKLVEFFTHAEHIHTLVDWTYFYAHPDSSLFLQVQASKLPPEDCPRFHEEHSERKRLLAPHIDRVQTKRPLLTSEHLKRAGITPGKTMGVLLKKGEELAIIENLHTPEEVMQRLKETGVWV